MSNQNEMKLTTAQFEAIITAMFACENEIDHLDYLILSTEDENMENFLKEQKDRRVAHFEALKEMIESNGRSFKPYED